MAYILQKPIRNNELPATKTDLHKTEILCGIYLLHLAKPATVYE